MSKWNKLTLTNKGAALLAKCQARGLQLTLTNVKLGNGQHAAGQDLKAMTNLVSHKQTISIDSKSVVDASTCKIISSISNNGLAAGYYLREIGLFAVDPDEGEILYMVNYDSAPDYLPASNEGSPIEQEFIIYATVRDADNVSIEVDYERSYRKEDTYSKEEVNTKLGEKADKADTYTKSQVDDIANNKLDLNGGIIRGNVSLGDDLDLSKNDNTLATAKFIKGQNYIPCYTSVSQLGLTLPCTTIDIVKAMPNNTQAQITAELITTTITDAPASYGVLTIHRGASIQRTDIGYKQSSGGGGTLRYYASFNSNNDTLTWYKYTSTAI